MRQDRIEIFILVVLVPLLLLLCNGSTEGSSEEITFKSAGLTLHGTLYTPDRNAPKAFVVLCHGNRGRARQHLLYARMAELLSRDYVVLSFDYRGFGESEKPHENRYMSFDFSEDIMNAVRLLSNRFQIPEEEVILLGHSLGALQVLNAGKKIGSRMVIALGPSDIQKKFLSSKRGQKYYIDKIYRKTKNRMDETVLASVLAPLLFENIFLGCRNNRVFLVFGEYEYGRKRDTQIYIEQMSGRCGGDINVEIVTIPYADHMYGTEPTGLLDNLQTIFQKENSEVIRLVARIRELIEGKHQRKKALPGQVIVDPNNPSWLKYNGGGTFFMCGPGDPEGFLYRGARNSDGTRDGDQMKLINKLKNTGANSIYLMAVRSHGGDAPRDSNDSSDPRFQNPFVDGNPSRGVDQDILNQWETWFSEMDRSGIVIFLFLYDDGSNLWDTGHTVETEEQEFIETLVNRFEHHKRLIWAVAEEYQEALSAERVRNIASVIRMADDYDHVIAVHKLHGLNFSEFADDPNIDQFAIQYNSDEDALHEGIVKAWKNAAGRYNLNMSESIEHGTGLRARKNSWASAMGGAYVMILGMDIANTPVTDLEDCGRLVTFFESTNVNEMAPHDELASGGTEYVLALIGERYITYASQLKGEIGLRQMVRGVYDFHWYDVQNGNSVIKNRVEVAAGDQRWSKPRGIGNELALYITRTKPQREKSSQ